ncbi:MAG: Holliday junction branch migration protein RuvA [Alphaproteobacteria bacterium]|nr:Holliday junction branch migration protein RuvA [Alphaproteobacteria bacterium]
MIATLTGTLVDIGTHDAIIRVNGVGYRFQASSRCLGRMGGEGAEVTVLIDTQIKDDRIILTGFSDRHVQDTYSLLQTVQGVGVKAALSILSALSPDDVVLAISAGDKAMITRADGVGPKLAQRVINELADKVASFTLGSGATAAAESQAPTQLGSAINDTVSALVNLGYGRAEAHSAAVRIAAETNADSVEALLPQAHKELGR